MSSAKGVGIPIKLMHEAEGHVVTVILSTCIVQFKCKRLHTTEQALCRLS